MPESKSTPRFKKNKILLIFSFLVVLELLLFVFTFRQLRDTLPPPYIKGGAGMTVGYSHYAGYPFYFDTVLFLTLFLSPILLLFILSKKIKK